MSHVDAIAVLLEYLKLSAIRVQQAQRVSSRGQIEPIRRSEVVRPPPLRVKISQVARE
jgi:hypothetical protein